MILLLDNFDSFTWNLYDYILQCSAECVVKRNTEITIEEIELLNPKAILFSPGPGKPKDHPLMFSILEKYHQTKPIFGVCLGFQAMGEFMGDELMKSTKPIHGKTSEINHDGESIFMNIPSPFVVTRYHSLSLSGKENKGWKISATTTDGVPMAGYHTQYPMSGVQFHPEAILTTHGLQLIRNWVTTIS
ncbi:MAG: aminodeoxychorismate/anthranilate synthase component II [Bacteroidetes bacterium]|nr:aminodeoxychorismate/anthranilate synthase component II [Bacteroidota bacterium]